MREIGALVRSMLTLCRAAASGVLSVRSGARLAEIAFSEGLPRAISVSPPDGETVGSLLAQAGSLDAARETRSKPHAPRQPIGLRLVAEGRTDEAALARALQRQLRDRFRALLDWTPTEIVFEPRAPDVGIPWIPSPPDFADLIVDALRAQDEEKNSADGPVFLTETAEQLLERAALRADERSLIQALRRSDLDAARDVLARSLHCRRLLSGLVAAGLCTQSLVQDAVLLARASRAVRRSQGSEALLRDRIEDPRRTLRSVTARLHPDRFDRAPAPLREASNHVFRALMEIGKDFRPAS